MHEQEESPVRVLIVAGAEAATQRLQEELSGNGFAPEFACVTTMDEVRTALARAPWDVVIVDADSTGSVAREIVQECSAKMACLVVAESMGVEQAIAFIRAGAHAVEQLHLTGRLSSALRETIRMAEQQREPQRAAERLAMANRALRLLSSINQALMRADEEEELLRMACQIAVEVAGYRFAWVGIAERDAERTVRPCCHAGYDDGYLEAVRVSWADDECGRGPVGTAIRTMRPSFIRDVAREPAFSPWHVQASQRGYRSVIGLPLLVDGQCIGALTLYDGAPNDFPEEEVTLLMELANDIAFGIEVLRTRVRQQQGEEALRESEEKFRVLTEYSPAFVGVIRGTHFIYVNPYMVQQSGYSQDELLTMDFSTLLHPDFREMVTQRARQRLRGEEAPNRYEYKMLTKSGEERWVDLNVTATTLEGERIIIGLGIDITERKQAEEALERERALLAAAIQMLPLPLVFVTPEHDLLLGNKAAYTFFRDPDPVQWQYVKWLAPNHQPVPIEQWPAIRALEHRETLTDVEGIVLFPDGSEVPVLHQVAPVIVNDELVAAVAVFQDITPLKEADRAKDQFLMILTHEIKTPLTSIIGWAQLALDAPEMRDEALAAIARNALQQKELLERLLILARSLSGKLGLRRSLLDVWQLAVAVAETQRPALAQQGLMLSFEPPGVALPVMADEPYLRTAIKEVLDNARLFTPAGGRITLIGRRDDERAVLIVRDTGRGIAPEQLSTLLRPFQQVQRQEAQGGLGIGLVIAQGIIEAHGGQLTFASPGVGAGSSVTMEVPLQES